jgi:proteasome lid subunit RPN8/RPN11
MMPITNVEDGQDRFLMDSQEQVDAILRIEDEGLQLLGIYHSHPKGPEEPSESDINEAAYPEAGYLIWSPGVEQWSCRAFIIEQDTVREIPIVITG